MKKYNAYIGTDSVRGSKGVYWVTVDAENGELAVKGYATAHDPGYLAIDAGKKAFTVP